MMQQSSEKITLFNNIHTWPAEIGLEGHKRKHNAVEKGARAIESFFAFLPKRQAAGLRQLPSPVRAETEAPPERNGSATTDRMSRAE